jgi:hypothetical protein
MAINGLRLPRLLLIKHLAASIPLNMRVAGDADCAGCCRRRISECLASRVRVQKCDAGT